MDAGRALWGAEPGCRGWNLSQDLEPEPSAGLRAARHRIEPAFEWLKTIAWLRKINIVIGGEQREMDQGQDSPEYTMDAATLGIPKGWIITGCRSKGRRL